MKYKWKDKVRIKSKKELAYISEVTDAMLKHGGAIMTIACLVENADGYIMEEDDDFHYLWSDEMIEGLVEEETKPKKDISLTQEQINTMVHDSCVLFCKHCGCGIPRETCTSLGTCKEHDEYRDTIRTHLMEKKKKEYPKTIAECKDETVAGSGYKTASLLTQLERLLICRDAYWKLAGDWKPDWAMYSGPKHCIIYSDNQIKWQDKSFVTESKVLAFPTKEMRDAFYENFKELIEQCKELL